MQDQKLTRRTTLRLLIVAPLGAAVLSACGKKTEPDKCEDVSALTEAEKSARTALAYTDKAPDKERHCSACTYWEPAKEVAQCGGCQLVKGPIHPNGFCTAYLVKAA